MLVIGLLSFFLTVCISIRCLSSYIVIGYIVKHDVGPGNLFGYIVIGGLMITLLSVMIGLGGFCGIKKIIDKKKS